MKIKDLEVIRTSSPLHKTAGTNWLFVKILTDTDIVGWGEGSLQYKDSALEAEICDMKKFLIDKNPLNIEDIWTSLFRKVTWSGGAVTMSAISAIDLALWDIKGKAYGVPVYDLVGGKTRDKVKVYANGWFENISLSSPTARKESPKLYAESASKLVDDGWKALKFYPFGGPQVTTPEQIFDGVNLVEVVRSSIGNLVDIGVDIRARLNTWSASRVEKQLRPLNIAWMEEPILYDNSKAIIEFAKASEIPISTGEQLYSRWEFRPIIESGVIPILQPDICHAGGFSELKKISSAAETYYASIAPHNSNGPISTIASIHLGMSIPNIFMQEIFISFIERYKNLLTNPPDINKGFVEISDSPGWGTDLIEDNILKYPPGDFIQVESEPYQSF